MSTNIKVESQKGNNENIFYEKQTDLNDISKNNSHVFTDHLNFDNNNYHDHLNLDNNHISGYNNYKVIKTIIFVPKPTTLGDIFPFLFAIFVYGLLVQSLLALWKRIHPGSHRIFQILLIFLFPVFFLVFASDLLLIAMWLLLVIIITYCLGQIYCSQMTYKIPRKIFRIFKKIIVVTNIGIFVAHILLFLSFFKLESFVFFSARFFAYAVYFSVLCREIILNLSHVMAMKSGYFTKDGLPNIANNAGRCMICTEELSTVLGILTLRCDHSYHTECIRGWSLVGQNKYCPYCKHGIDSTFFKLEFWDKTDLPFLPLMNLVRSFISFFIIIFLFFVVKTI